MSEIELGPWIMGQRIAEARKARGKTQEAVAEFLDLSRPTFIAIEKGERRAKDDEILKLALFLGRTVNELVRRVEPVTDLQPHFRAVIEKSKSGVRSGDPVHHVVVGLLLDAQSFPPLALASRRSRPLPIHAVVDLNSHPALTAHRHSTGSGYLHQGRFKSSPVQSDDNFWPFAATWSETRCGLG